MRHATWLLPLAMAVATACSKPTPEQQITNDAATALGGRDRILAVKTLVIEGEGVNGNLGQDVTPEATTQAFNLTDYKRPSISWPACTDRTTRTPTFTHFQGQAPRKQCSASTATSATTWRRTAPPRACRTRRQEIGARTCTITRHQRSRALDPAAKLAIPTNAVNLNTVLVTTPDGLCSRCRSTPQPGCPHAWSRRPTTRTRRRVDRNDLRRVSGRQRVETPGAPDDETINTERSKSGEETRRGRRDGRSAAPAAAASARPSPAFRPSTSAWRSGEGHLVPGGSVAPQRAG